ncbi:histidinol-phosphate transaminase [Magnetovibrio blakemorei]|uniref:Histidinol-phosphate aminotransferase n=1 Tax=Magnetovibrio blakemorei TaxID=28181 RepID=A0A1E5QC22_9PROT|nr:histidinol-phosphate transaminase [Magnetovibrio blakemorei]OEJ69624.1 histidinol-phosphate transaminase [Magnetovibrio blakemorei]
MSPQIIPRPGILDISPYVGGDSKIAGVDRIIKLASNEGPFGPSPLAIEAMKTAASSAHRYPDGGALALREAIAKRFGLDVERIVCGAGSDQLLSLLTYSYAGPGDEVLYTEHGFLIYPIAAKAAGATPVKAPETNLRTDVDALLDAVTDKTRIVFIANPNNPTGTYLSHAELTALRAGLPDDVLLVIDAAYAEFVGRNDYTPGTELVDAGQNTVMTRTFSKLFALGGLRVGWGYFPSEIADVLNRVREPFNVSVMGQAAGIASMQDVAFQQKCFEHNLSWIAKTEAALHDLGIETTASVGNFVLARFGEVSTAERADAFLRERGIIVRRVASYGLPDCLRISMGTADEMEAFLATMRAFMGASQ